MTDSTSAACAHGETEAHWYDDPDPFREGRLDGRMWCNGPERPATSAARPDLRQEDYDATARALYTSALYGWNLERKGDVVRAVCTFCRYSFVRGIDDTMREFVEVAGQHDCR